MSTWTAQLLIVSENSWDRGRTGIFPSRGEFTNCVLRDKTSRPDSCPLPKHAVLFSTIVHSGYKALFRLLVISCKKKRKLIETIHIPVKNIEKILASRIGSFTVSICLGVSLVSHFPHLSIAA